MTAGAPLLTFADAQAYLYSRFDFERTMVANPSRPFKLDRMLELSNRLGAPHQPIKAIHIAGTKGKGSTAVMTATVLTKAGYKTGLFTSPHLENLRQRFQINGELCSEEEFIQLVNQLIPVVTQMDLESENHPNHDLKPTFFELTTALAFLLFQKNQVDFAVIEVGLGGRLDSTNICNSIVTGITSISLDHTSLLGNTVEEIAIEKAGIIKQGIPLVHGCQQSEPRQQIEAIAHQKSAPSLNASRDIQFQIKEQTKHYSTVKDVTIAGHLSPKVWPELTIGLPGAHQIQNAMIVLGIIQCLKEQGYPVDDPKVIDGLANVSCPGRLEQIDQQPEILLDVAHNPDSIDKLVAFLQQHYSEKKWHLIFGCSQDKQADVMLEKLSNRFASVTVTQFQNNPRAIGSRELYNMLSSQPANSLFRESSPGTALIHVRQLANPDDLIVVTGSFYLVAEIREILFAHPTSA
ncbi:MAG: folylpolyglutamate synthase/dihydrofolate synthase family protein [Planctomycetota bacterium]|nr:folylpolyglutamate synthase/dihydrofolate synthase family protein [Planctomycetota bacterium]